MTETAVPEVDAGAGVTGGDGQLATVPGSGPGAKPVVTGGGGQLAARPTTARGVNPGPTRFECSRPPFGVYVIVGLQLLIVLSNWADVVRLGLDLSPLALPDLPNQALAQWLSVGITLLVAVVAVGLLALRRWAWFATMLIQGAALAYGIRLYFEGGEPYLSLLLNSLAVFYLNQRDVRRCFEKTSANVMQGAASGPAP